MSGAPLLSPLLLRGDCLTELKRIPDGSVDAVAYLEGFNAIGCEMTPDYWPLIEHRIERARQ